MSLNDFPNQADALQCADELIAMNKEKHGHSGDKNEHPKQPLLSLFLYIEDEGQKRSITQVESKTLSASANLKGKRQVEEAACHVEGVG